ncbi:hypothetical protein ACI2WT_11870 [Lysinibacillus fusiformis]
METLIVKNNSCLLPYKDSAYFNFSRKYTMDNNRYFTLNHPQADEFIEKLGVEETFYLNRLFLSYFDAVYRLADFWSNYAQPEKLNLTEKLTIQEIERILSKIPTVIDDIFKEYSLEPLEPVNTNSLKYANYFRVNDQEKYIEANPLKEYIWSLHRSEILKSVGIKDFHVAKIESKDIFKSEYLFAIALKKKEVSIALYDWSNIYNYNQSDFIARINNIFELIAKDIKKNKIKYSKTKNQEVWQCVEALYQSIENSSRTEFYAIFNSSETLGTYSRHAPKEIVSIKGFNNKRGLNAEQISKDLRVDHLFPDEQNLNYLLRFWYFTASILLLNWLRLQSLVVDIS